MEWLINLINTMPGAIAQGFIWGLMAIGVYITYKILDIADLTVDGSMVTGAAVCAVLVTSGCNVWLAMVISILAGMLTGLVTGLLHTFMGIPAILAGILTQLMLWSANLVIMSGRSNIALPARNFVLAVARKDIVSSLVVLAVISALFIALLYWFFGTELGCSVRATGCNQHMSRAQGINTSRNKILGLVLSNGLVALAGALNAQYLGSADINGGKGAIVIGLAAVIIGEALFSKICKNFAFRLFSVILGGIIYFIVYQVVVFIGLDTNLLKMISAIVVTVFLAVPYLKATYFAKPVKRGDRNA